jgi:hypothetical protein
VSTSQRGNAKQKTKDIAITLFTIGFVVFLLSLVTLPIQRYWLHGPVFGAKVKIFAEAGGRWRKPSSDMVEQTVFYYVVEMPDGSREHVALPERFPVGSEVEIMFTRGTLTGTLFVTAIRHEP